MNEKQKKITQIFIFFVCSILLCITGLISFALFQSRLSAYGDIWDRAIAIQHMTWIPPAMAILVGVLITSIFLFIGMWVINKTPERKQSK